MKTTISHEFFYYNSQLTPGHHDFTDDRVLSPSDRLEFLSHYDAFCRRTFGLSEHSQQAVDLASVQAALPAIAAPAPQPQISRRLCFSTMQASARPVQATYEGWSLYTPYVHIADDRVIFEDHRTAPTPAAAYRFVSETPLTGLSFSFVMSHDYAAEIPGGILDTTPGRTVELRNGIHDLIKLEFYSNGECYVRLGAACPYHLKNVRLGQFAFDRENSITLQLTDGSFYVYLNDQESGPFPLDRPFSPDTLFVGCGMFHLGTWEFIPQMLQFNDRHQTAFFTPAATTTPVTEPLGEVTLPYRIGGERRRDQLLILEKEFSVTPTGRALLSVDSLDPHGEIWLNDECLYESDDFQSVQLDVTAQLRSGCNRLKLVVYPRAPETLFNWHRQTDPYNGWFCGEVSLTLSNTVRITQPEVLTQTVDNGEVTCALSAVFDRACVAEVTIRRIFPEPETDERTICRLPVDRELNTVVRFPAEVWSPEHPVLYAVRFIARDTHGHPLDDEVVETGFRTIRQENGRLWLNNQPIVLTGALLMQFLPPYTETSAQHICPTDERVLWQEMMLKALGGNTLRIHILGYGTNDPRYARYADRLGLLVIWTTRYIDSVEQMLFEETWQARDGYIRQLKARINHPSIILWEGTNEYHPSLRDIDRIYKAFVPAVKAADPSRLICPVSHLYYAGDMIPKEGCAFYNDSGTTDHKGDPAIAPAEWNDPAVVRSAHTYEILLGYGTGWDKLRTQAWSMQPELYHSPDHAYLVTEFAVIGRQDPSVPEAQTYFNPYSYELPNDDVLGFRFTEEQWRESQAYQALAAAVTTRVLHLHNADAMLWCCLMGGANDGGYLKPIVDNYGYAKLAFHTLREGFQPQQAVSDDVDVIKGNGFSVTPAAIGTRSDHRYQLTAVIRNERGEPVAEKIYPALTGGLTPIRYETWTPTLPTDGYYELHYTLTEL